MTLKKKPTLRKSTTKAFNNQPPIRKKSTIKDLVNEIKGIIPEKRENSLNDIFSEAEDSDLSVESKQNKKKSIPEETHDLTLVDKN